jgi:SAM-dependent methyltransferase
MSFEVAADAYQQFMGRYADPLAPLFADAAGVRAGEAGGQRALDVGCGPGALTAVLVERLGAGAVAAIDPSPPFVAAARARFPGVDVRQGAAESLPHDDGSFDVALAQLVVHFMADPVGGLREMARVTASGGTVAACTWDFGGGRGPLSPFWAVAGRLRGTGGESGLPGTRAGQLTELFERAGLAGVTETDLTVSVRHETFADWWLPYTRGVGPAGDYVAGLAAGEREELRAACAAELGPGPVTIESAAWVATGTVSR